MFPVQCPNLSAKSISPFIIADCDIDMIISLSLYIYVCMCLLSPFMVSIQILQSMENLTRVIHTIQMISCPRLHAVYIQCEGAKPRFQSSFMWYPNEIVQCHRIRFFYWKWICRYLDIFQSILSRIGTLNPIECFLILSLYWVCEVRPLADRHWS